MINIKKYCILLLQVSIVLMAFLVVPASATEPPVVLEGNLLIDGDPAPIGTKVTVVAEGMTLSETTVTTEGLFGDERSNRLGVHSSYDVVTIYVNGVETQTLDLTGYQSGEMVPIDLAATSAVISSETKTTTTGGGGGGGGFGSSGAVADEEETEPASTTEEVIEEPEVEEEVLQSTPDVKEGEPIPVSTSQGSNAIIILGIVVIVAAIGIYMYRAKK